MPPSRGDSCAWANDGVCDEPQDCSPGTDAFDCGNNIRDDACVLSDNAVCDEPHNCAFGTDSKDCCTGSGWSGVVVGGGDASYWMTLSFLLVVLFALIRFVVRRRCRPALRQTQRIAGDDEISEGGVSYGKWYLVMTVFLSCTTGPIWIVGGVVVPIASQAPKICNPEWTPFPWSGAYYCAIVVLGLVPLVIFMIASIAYQYAGCCGGGGLVRLKSSEAPTAAEGAASDAAYFETASTAILRRVRQPWFERIFYPILLLEELERHPPRRPTGTFKVRMPPGRVEHHKVYVATTFSGRAYFKAPAGTRGGDLVWVKLPDVYADGADWGDNAERGLPPHETVRVIHQPQPHLRPGAHDEVASVAAAGWEK